VGELTGAYSRRRFLQRGAAAVGGLALLDPAEALAGAGHHLHRGDPRPIPGGFDSNFVPTPDPTQAFVHVLPPGIGFEMSTITDFKGIVAGSEIRGTARGSDGTGYDFDTDMRFMQGTYIDVTGRVREGSFGFI
jgi:hypothetical protein